MISTDSIFRRSGELTLRKDIVWGHHSLLPVMNVFRSVSLCPWSLTSWQNSERIRVMKHRVSTTVDVDLRPTRTTADSGMPVLRPPKNQAKL